MKPYDKYIESKPGVCGGAPVIRGTRIRLKVVLDNLAEGHTPEEIVKEYPGLTLEAVYAAIAYAAAAAADEMIMPLPAALTA
ncbi:MAG: DUF433 domain-containing protein [Deltaproteobacteria bacterium]|nr:DUF433 domain-containing protein [Deltaproteobacteria bacterium]